MKSTRRAFIAGIATTALVGFNQSPAEALSFTRMSEFGALAQKKVIEISAWAYPHVKDQLLGVLAEKSLNYIIENYKDFVNVIIHATQETMKAIENALRQTVDDHLFQIATSAIAAGIVITVAITGPGSLWLVPAGSPSLKVISNAYLNNWSSAEII